MTTPYRIARRSFLHGIGGAVGLAHLLRRTEAAAAGATPPKRLLIIHRPNGTIRSNWLPKGAGAGATVGSILAPFQKDPKVKASMVVVDGLDVVMVGGGEDSHEGPIITIMTGGSLDGTRLGDRVDYINSAASMDVRFGLESPAMKGTPFPSLQLGAHNRPDGHTIVANRVMSYEGKDKPIYPELKPSLVYTRLFGSMAPGVSAEALMRARAKRKSVLDFIRKDVTRLGALVPSDQKDKIDAHATAIRELETTLDNADKTATTCTAPSGIVDQVADDMSANTQKVGKSMLALIKAAFACDLTRSVGYMWSAPASQVVFEGLYQGMPKSIHHPLSHEDITKPDIAKGLTAIETWYSTMTADFLGELAALSNGAGGSVLDDTLVLYVTEVSQPHIHSFKQMPFAIFGGKGVRLQGDRIVNYAGHTTNDLWTSLAPTFGMNLDNLGTAEQRKGVLQGLFA